MNSGNLKYTPTHNWINLKRKFVTIGVTDYLIKELGNLIAISLPKVGDEIISGISYGEIESINELYDLIVPIDGEVMKVNSDLFTNLKKLERDPFGDGWFVKVRILEPKTLDTLMNEDEYKEYKKSIRKKRKRL